MSLVESSSSGGRLGAGHSASCIWVYAFFYSQATLDFHPNFSYDVNFLFLNFFPGVNLQTGEEVAVKLVCIFFDLGKA